VTVHDIDVQQVTARFERGAAILSEPREVCGEDRRGDEQGSGCEA